MKYFLNDSEITLEELKAKVYEDSLRNECAYKSGYIYEVRLTAINSCGMIFESSVEAIKH